MYNYIQQHIDMFLLPPSHMSDDYQLLRRELLELGGAFAVGSGLGGGSGRPAFDPVSAPAATVSADDRADVVAADHLVTGSRGADVVLWQDDDGTVHADGEDAVIASGDDFSAVMQAAVDTGASKIVVQDGHYVAERSVYLQSDTIVQGTGTGTTIEVADSVGFELAGERTAETRVTADLSVGDVDVPVADASAFEPGEFVLVTSDRRTDYRDQPYGELQRVVAVGSGRVTVATGGLFDDYAVADGTRVVGLDTVSNVVVRDFEFVGTDQSAYRSAVFATYAEGVHVRSCVMHGLGFAGVAYISTAYSSVADCEVYDVGYDAGGVGYGVALLDAVRNVTVRDSVFRAVRNHGTAVSGRGRDGYPRLLTFESNEYEGTDADVHFGGLTVFRNNRFVHGEGGILTGGDDTVVLDCEFRNLSGDGVSERGDPDRLLVDGCRFREVGGRALNFYSNPSKMNYITVSNSRFREVDSNVLRYRTADGDTAEVIRLTNNDVGGCETDAVIVAESGGGEIRALDVTGNRFADIDGVALIASQVSGATRVLGNDLNGIGGSYALTVGGMASLVANNVVRDFAGRGLFFRGSGLLTGNTFADGGDNAILIFRSENVLVAENHFENTTNPDIRENDSTACKFVRNNFATGVRSDGEAVIRENFGYRTETSGTYAASGDGGRSFDIPHDLVAEPAVANVWAESADAAGPFYVSARDDETVTVTYREAPPRGTENLRWGFSLAVTGR
jgi:hypothetical protein